jgi:isocitrate/isopropylmalate dehydrogenase
LRRDGIGPEVTAAGRTVLDAVHPGLEHKERPVGPAALREVTRDTLGDEDDAAAVEQALDEMLAVGFVAPDLGSSASTR